MDDQADPLSRLQFIRDQLKPDDTLFAELRWIDGLDSVAVELAVNAICAALRYPRSRMLKIPDTMARP